MSTSLIILAGGKNLRLGRTKALETIGGKSLIERVIERLKLLSSQILIVTSAEQLEFPVGAEAKIVIDLYPGKGPLGGIYTGLLASGSSHGIVVACDMPFLNADLLNYMMGLSEGYDAVVPRLEKEMVEPLHAVYSRTCLEKMKERLDGGQLSIYSFLDTARVRYVEQEESLRFDPQLLSFFNINYQSDVDRAIALVENENN